MKNTRLSFSKLKLSYGERLRPQRDWFILLMIAVLLVGVSLAWNVYLLQTVERGGTLGNTAPTETFDATPLESVRTLFETRREEELRYRREYRFVDPSR